MTEHDVAIIGGGAAGCILAARLSEDAQRRVALIEAGADTPPGAMPSDIADTYPVAYSNPTYFWPGLTASGREGSSATPYSQARIMGGGSSVMGMWALRGLPGDYDSWAAAGAIGWSWDDVLPSFKRLERDLDFSGPEHGDAGPIPVRRYRRDHWPGFAQALLNAAERRGLRYRDDLNADFEDGVFPVPVTNDASGRVTSASGYLTADVRRRSNLAIMAGTEARRVILDGRRVIGVEVQRGDRVDYLGCREAFVCAGAIGSPTLLMRSGIGPSDHLRSVGLVPSVDLPGVGQRLQNHCVLNLATLIAPGARQSSEMRTYGLALARLSSGFPGAPGGDLHLQFVAKTSSYSHGDRIGLIGAALCAPVSRGSVRLAAADSHIAPHIEFRLLENRLDHDRLKLAVGLALQLLDDPEVRRIRREIFAVLPTSLIRRLNRPSRTNRLASFLVAFMLDSPRAICRQVLTLGCEVLTDTDFQAQCFDRLLPYVIPVYHPTGTCAIGRSDDTLAVLDARCRVRGVTGLLVVDASIMPTIPRGNTCLPVMMIAEHASALYRSGRS